MSDTERHWTVLDARERRVLGVLIEKAKTTPAGYPMTINAIVTACNQKNNRDPVSSYDDMDVGQALDVLRGLNVVSEIDWMGRAAKYKHDAYKWLGVTPVELAVMGELLLRGAQTLGDLRVRAARMEPIEDLGALKPIVDGLIARGLMIELTPPGRGQLVSHNLYREDELEVLKSRAGSSPIHESRPAPSSDRVEQLTREVEALRAAVADLTARLEALEAGREVRG
jgi:uncharacterized protein YceH (UPF0502 family)